MSLPIVILSDSHIKLSSSICARYLIYAASDMFVPHMSVVTVAVEVVAVVGRGAFCVERAFVQPEPAAYRIVPVVDVVLPVVLYDHGLRVLLPAYLRRVSWVVDVEYDAGFADLSFPLTF